MQTLSRRKFTALAATIGASSMLPGFLPCALAQEPDPDQGGKPDPTPDQDIASRARALPTLHSMLVQLGDEVVFSEAIRGPGLERVANIKSCSKSLVALLLGSAIEREEIASVQARLVDVAPDIVPSDATPGVEDITLEDLVTMRAGLAPTSGPNYGAWISSRNWVSYVLRQPMEDKPGGRMIYSTGSTHVLGAALSEATGESLLSLARTRLGKPLGIEVSPWTRDPQGYYMGGNQMALTPKGMPRIAVMMRDEGVFRDEQVFSADWIEASRQPLTRSRWSGLGYGYGWFLSESGYMLARGYGGQIIAANPKANLAVAITSDPTQPARSDGYFGELMQLLDGPVLDLAKS